jgi:hypothetical protein
MAACKPPKKNLRESIMNAIKKMLGLGLLGVAALRCKGEKAKSV